MAEAIAIGVANPPQLGVSPTNPIFDRSGDRVYLNLSHPLATRAYLAVSENTEFYS